MASENHASLSSTTLFARNLPFTLDDKTLEKVFSEVGPVKRCFVVKDKGNPGKCRGFGYITFALKDDAVRAKDTIKQISGRKVFLTFSNKKPRHKTRGQPEESKPDENGNDDMLEDPKSMNSSATDRPLEKSLEVSDKLKRKPKSERSNSNNTDGRTVALSGFLANANIKQLKKACKRFGEVEQFVHPIENYEKPTAHVVYKSHKMCRIAANGLNGKTVKGSILNAVVLSKEHKTQSAKSLKKSRLIIRNLSFKCSEEVLRKEFSKFGDVSEIVLPMNNAGKAKKKSGFAFVQYKSVFDAAKAVEAMNQKEIQGRPIAVDWALPKKKYELLKVEENDGDNVGQESLKDENHNEVDSNNLENSDNEQDSDHEGGEDDDESNEGEKSGSDELSADESMDEEASDMDEDKVKINNGTTKKKKLRDAREGKTIFIRNLPFAADEDEISEAFEKFGKIAYCKVVMDGASEHSRGSAFLKFEEKESAEDCLSKCTGENGASEEIRLKNRLLDITLAVPRGKLSKLLDEKDSAKKTPRDKRNLYLAKEGLITPGSEAAVGLTKSDFQKRQKAEAEKKAKLAKPNYFVSRTRLCFRNLPLSVDKNKLTKVLRTVCEGQPKNVGKVLIMRSNDRLDSSGVGRSKGFGFVEFHTHEDALEVLRATNNNPSIFGPDRRPIVEFAIENSLILKRQEQQKLRNKYKHERMQQEQEHGEKEEVSKERKGIKRKWDRNKNKDNEDRTTKGENQNKRPRKDNQHENKEASPCVRDPVPPVKHNINTKFRGNRKNKIAQKTKGDAVSSSTSSVRSIGNKKSFERNAVDSSRSRNKQKSKANQEEQNFQNIVEKYKSKLFGADNNQLKTSRWFQ